jgi:hypothetical protein
MVSVLHEGVLELLRERPGFAAKLAQLVDAPVPRFREARAVDPTLTQVVPLELHADSVVVLAGETPVLGIIVESQLQRDDRKLFTWPAYAVCARARHTCPCVLIVVTPSSQVAAWASVPIDLGCGSFRALVLGPEQIPKVTELHTALAAPDLTMLSVIVHGKGDVATAIQIARAAYAVAQNETNEERQALYLGLIEAALSEAVKQELDMKLSEMKFPPRAYTQAKVEGKAEALLKVLEGRGIATTAAQRAQIAACTDGMTMDDWLDRSISVSSIAELLGWRAPLSP